MSDPMADWELVWSDEFEGPEGQPPDPERWVHDVGGHGWGNEQLEFDSDRSENASLDGQGNLRIIARKESYGGREYSSARIKTQGLFTTQYGRVEARIKLPIGKGIWPAFWMLGADYPEVGWPQCGEIDIMEYRGQEPWIIHGSLHGPGYSGGSPISASHTPTDGGTLYDEFHTYAVVWDASRIAFEVDGYTYQVVTPQQLPGSAPWVYDHPFFIILNVAVGGHYVGAPDAATQFPQTMLVDYVRVWTRKQ